MRVAPARIGPNAIIQVAHVLRERLGPDVAAPLVHDATGYTLDALPSAMVDEAQALALTHAVMQQLGEGRATKVLHEAGARTADYLLANRIPRPAQWVMKAAPRRAGLSLLLKAMQQHAWTFAGSGTFSVHQAARGTELTFHACAMCRGLATNGAVCDFYAGTFERLIQVLIDPFARVFEVECMAQGGRCCRFQVVRAH